MNSVPRDRSGSAGGIIASARTLGQTVGSALVVGSLRMRLQR